MFLIFVSFWDDVSGGSVVKNPPANAGDVGSVLGSGRSPGEGKGNPLQYACLGNPMDRGAWWATVHGITELDMTAVTKHACMHTKWSCSHWQLV